MTKVYPTIFLSILAACCISITLAAPGRTGDKSRPGQAPSIGLTGFDGGTGTATVLVPAGAGPATATNIDASGFDATAFCTGNLVVTLAGANGYGTPNPITAGNQYLRVARAGSATISVTEIDLKSDDGSVFNLQSIALFATLSVGTDNAQFVLTGFHSGVQVGSPVTFTASSTNTAPLAWTLSSPNFNGIDQIKITVSDLTNPANFVAALGVDAITLIPLSVINPALSAGTVGLAYTSENFTATGGTAPYTFAVTSGALPAGMSLSSAGTLSGTPTAGGTFNFSVTATDATAQTSGADAVSLTINPPTIALSPASLSDGQYQSAYTSITFAASGGVAPYTYSATGLPPGMSISGAGVLSGTPTAAGTYSVTVSATDHSTGTGPYVLNKPYTLVVDKVPLTITANNATKVYGAALPTLGVSYSGFVGGDNSGSLTVAPTITTPATAASAVGSYGITASGAIDPNYAISYVAGSLTISTAALTITANDIFKVYGAALPLLTASYSGFVNGDNTASLSTGPTFSTSATAASPVNNYPITPSGAVDPNYTISYVPGTLTIGQAPLTITANNASTVYGAALPTLTASYSGFVNGDNSASLSTGPTLSTTATAASAVNTYPITASGAVDANYAISYVAGTLTIGQAPLTVTADNQSMTYGSALPALTVSYSGFVNGDTQASLTTAATASTTATSASPANTYTITPSGAVDGNYAITYVDGTLTIGQAALTVTADNQSMTYGSALPALTVSYSGFVNGDTQASLTTAATASTTATSASPAGGYTITPSGAVDGNYAVSYVTGTLTIGQAPLTIIADNQSMTYGSALPALTVSYSGFVNGDTQASLTTAATASTTATSASPANTYTITPSGAVDGNYAITYVDGTLTIGQAALTVTADNQSMTYGSALPALTVSYSGFVNGDTQASLTTAATASTPATSASPAGGYTITPSGAVDANYAITYVNGTLTIGQAALTITADNQSMTYGSALPALTVSYSGFVNGDTQASLTTAATASTPATSASPAGGYTITPSGAVDPNYTISYVPGTLTIGQAPLTITADNQSMTYGSALPALTVSYSGFVNGDTQASLTTAATASTPATSASPAGGYTITPSGAVDGNYAITYVNGTLTIGQAPLTITADNQSMTYGSPLPALTVSYSGFVNGDNQASLTTAATASTTASSASPANTYTITPSGAVDGNYAITYVDGTLTIGQAPLTIIADNQSMTYGSALPTLTASYTGFVNGETVASLSTQPTLSTTATSASPVGGYTITPSGAVDGNYAISYVTGTLTIGQAPLTVTADNQSMIYGGALPALTVSYSGFVNGDTQASLTTAATASTTATSVSPVNTYTITPSGAVDGNYAISYVTGTLTIGQAPLTITADNQSMTYGSALPALTVSYSGFVNGDNQASLTTAATASTTATSASPVGGYTITPGGAVDGNYAISYVTGTLTIGQAPLTITADNQSMTYGSALPTLTASYTGFVNGETAASLSTQPTLSTTATSASSVGSYPIAVSGAVDPNYAISYVVGTLTIGPAAATITASDASMTYGSVLPPLSVTYSGLVNGDNAQSLTTAPTVSTTATSASAVGAYPISASGAVDPNYTFTYVPGTLTIGPAALTVTANNASMIYGSALPPLSVTYAGFVNGDTKASLTTAATAATTATSASPVNTYPITASGAVDPNYSITYVGGTLTIGPATLTVTATNESMTYGGTVPALAVTYSGFVNGDNSAVLSPAPTATTTATSASPVGMYPITPTGGATPNYTLAYVNGTLTVGPATVTVTAADESRFLGQPNPTLAVTYSGFVNGDNSSILTNPATATTTATIASPAGMYPITASGAAAANYDFTYVSGTLTVIQALPNVITFATLPTKTYGDPDFAIGATATSGLPVTFASKDNTIATVYQDGSGNWFVHIVSAGTVTIAAAQAGGSPYAPAAEVDQSLVIGKASQAILFPNPFTVVPTIGATIGLGATASSGLPITYTVSDPTLATVSGNQLTIVGSGTFTVTASQAGNKDYTAATPVTITLQSFDQRGFVSGVGVFPNPVHGTLHIRMSQDYQISKVVIFDLEGRIVLGVDEFTTNANDIPLNVTSLMPGIYILRVVCIRNHQLVYPNFKIEVQ